jgi:Flp pilus assembly protein CpaB
MHTYQTRNLALAGGLAVLALLLSVLYVATAGTHRAAASSTQTVVYVATRDIPAGTSGADAAKAMKAISVASAAAGDAVTSPSQVANEVVVQPLYKGEPVSIHRFAPLREQGIAGNLHGRLRAVVVSGDATQLLAGTLHDGDRVDLVASLKDPQSGRAYVRTVLRGVEVLHADESTGGMGSSTTYTATVRVNDAQAQTLFYVLKNADWTFELRPLLGAGDSSVGATSFQSLMAGH